MTRDYNEGREEWHESYVGPITGHTARISSTKRVAGYLGDKAARLFKPTRERLGSSTELFMAMPVRNSTPEEVRAFEEKYIPGHDSCAFLLEDSVSLQLNDSPTYPPEVA